VRLPVVWLPEADAELKEALARYESIRPALAERFAEAVVETVERISQAPLQYAVAEKGRRRAGVRRFPYGLFFLAEEKRIVVIACFHGRRNPRHWQLRRGAAWQGALATAHPRPPNIRRPPADATFVIRPIEILPMPVHPPLRLEWLPLRSTPEQPQMRMASVGTVRPAGPPQLLRQANLPAEGFHTRVAAEEAQLGECEG
jgi:plasmid stabilization system protein ParE